MTPSRINDLIRQAAGRNVPTLAPEQRPVGDIVGRNVPGPAAMRPRPATNSDVNDRIRAAVTLTRHATLAGGVHLHDVGDLDDLLGRR